ncbi:MAG: hypothetical protein V4850_31385 [Myxococcota bacterium]
MFLTTTTGAAAAATVGMGPGCDCDAECAATLIEVSYELVKLGFTIYEEITGKLLWENTGPTDRLVQALVCFVRSDTGECIQEEEFIVEVPANGEHEYDLSGFSADEEGIYHFLVKFLGIEEPSEEVEVSSA